MGERTKDPIEAEVARGLDAARLWYTREGDPGHPERGLDFYLHGIDIHIECKWSHSDRIAEQTSRFRNVIVVQGLEAAKLLSNALIVVGAATFDLANPQDEALKDKP